jgi:3-dehydro-L-gulonate 2-dehydrogenase
MRIASEEMQKMFTDILVRYGFSETEAEESASLFVQNSLDGVYSHGVNRFPRVIEYLKKGYIKPKAQVEKEQGFGGMERWNGNLAMGNLTAKKAMARAIELSKEFGLGCVAIRNTNHWMRGGAYGWQAAEAGCIGLCFTNTQPNMPAWGAKDRRIGNNPFVMAVPRSNGEHVVVDCAMAQYSYGKIEEAKLKGDQLPFPGGFDEEGNLSNDPLAIEKTWRVLPIGYWKGSSMSIVFDMIATMLSGGNSVSEIGKLGGDEFALSQVVLAIDPYRFGTVFEADTLMDQILNDLRESEPVQAGQKVRYPGERTLHTRKENLEKGIPVNETVWNTICSL